MKKFYFSLSNVLTYKEQLLDNLKNEHAQLLQKLVEKEKQVDRLKEQEKEVGKQIAEMQKTGQTISFLYQMNLYLDSIEKKIDVELERLIAYRKEESKKKAELIVAKQEYSSLEKLMEKKKAQYQAQVQKKEEQLIEEFVMNQRMILK